MLIRPREVPVDRDLLAVVHGMCNTVGGVEREEVRSANLKLQQDATITHQQRMRTRQCRCGLRHLGLRQATLC